MEYATAFDIGSVLELESVSSDCMNPYQFLLESSAETETAVEKSVTDLKQVI